MLVFSRTGCFFQEHGFFVECGAFTGEDRSNTLFFEKTRKWTGLLIEADPKLYAQVRSKNRKAFTINACLSPEPYPAMVSFAYYIKKTCP